MVVWGSAWMNDLYIQGVHIDWNKIPVNSYLREIDAIKGLEELIFHNSITFLLEKTEVENQPYWRHLQLPVGLTRKVGQRIIFFPHMIPIRNCMKLYVL